MAKPPKQAAVFRVQDVAQLEALALPARAEVLNAIAAHGPMTVAEVAALLDKRRPAIHYQVNILAGLGLLQDAGTRGTGRALQSLYQAPGRSMQLVFDKDDPVTTPLTLSHVKHLLHRASRSLLAGFQRTRVRTSGPGRNAHILQALCRLDPDRLAEVNEHIEALRELCSPETLDAEGDLHLVTFTLSAESAARP